MTAWGIFSGLWACLEETDGKAEFQGLSVALPGLGKVGYSLAQYLHQAGARLIVADVDATRADKAKAELSAEVCRSDRYSDSAVRHPRPLCRRWYFPIRRRFLTFSAVLSAVGPITNS